MYYNNVESVWQLAIPYIHCIANCQRTQHCMNSYSSSNVSMWPVLCDRQSTAVGHRGASSLSARWHVVRAPGGASVCAMHHHPPTGDRTATARPWRLWSAGSRRVKVKGGGGAICARHVRWNLRWEPTPRPPSGYVSPHPTQALALYKATPHPGPSSV